MKLANSVKVGVFCREDENSQEITKGLSALFPFNLEENKIKVQRTVAEGTLHNKIEIFEVFAEKETLVNDFIESLLNGLGKNQVEALKEQRQSRLDEGGNFFIRLDKKCWLEQSKMSLTDTGDCFHIKINIAAFPKKRENAMRVAEKILDKY